MPLQFRWREKTYIDKTIKPPAASLTLEEDYRWHYENSEERADAQLWCGVVDSAPKTIPPCGEKS